MATFIYEAVDRHGNTIKAEIEAVSESDAKHKIRTQDCYPTMVQVGEETGVLDKMLIRVADTYDSEVDTMVGTLTTLLEPVLVIGMGGAVGFMVIALFLPLAPMSIRLGRN